MPQDETVPNYTTIYHIPVNKELLDNVIPVENEIIYSSNMNIIYHIRNSDFKKPYKHPGLGGYLANRLAQSMNDFRGNYNTDVLITYQGIALNLPSLKVNKRGHELKKLPLDPRFVLWSNISFSKNGTLSIESVFNCELNFIPEFETEEKFIKRREHFYENVTNLRCSYTAECLKSARTSLDLNDNRKALEWIERGRKSNVFRSEFDYFDELNLLEAQIVKEETENKRKMVEEIDKFIIKYLQSNAGKAFTAESMMKRLVDELDNREWLDYLVINIEGVLNRLTFNGAIQVKQIPGSNFFFF